MLEMLAEPNVLAINGKQASFLAGGEFPFPMVQPAAAAATRSASRSANSASASTSCPTITPRGTIRLQVAPGSQLARLRQRGDHSRASRFPALTTRRVQTEVELESGQSFVIAGLLDNRMTETLNKIPGLANIPLLGKLFQQQVGIAQQFRTAGDRDARSGAADSRRAAAARR